MAWRRVSLVGLSIGAALTLAACGGSSEAVAPPTPTSTTTAAPVTTTTTTVPPVTTTTTTIAPTTTTEAPTTTLVDVPYEHNESYFFTSPDGAFQCGIIKLPSRTEAGCQGSTSPVPPRPADCMVDWGHGIRVENEGEGAFMCAGGLVYTSGDAEPDPVLPAGSKLTELGYSCSTTATAVTCANDETSHGFTVSPDSNETF
ncbi:DUF6636 domain-containing protein [Rhodococcus sp. WAY2]|uniref:DUF6636 domain-containing protein n=1 Tax=Rhodococcus sp. WAY2 TaxID=2663121 RepID=UPI0013204856|nr:DUF6636 domain-containing protein [Rhodococcus sp. WAY2]QHE71156.1 hypothetical protein GFS60_04756 [Rhodococcus sp. WAY2]